MWLKKDMLWIVLIEGGIGLNFIMDIWSICMVLVYVYLVEN